LTRGAHPPRWAQQQSACLGAGNISASAPGERLGRRSAALGAVPRGVRIGLIIGRQLFAIMGVGALCQPQPKTSPTAASWPAAIVPFASGFTMPKYPA
jgi:hypothetical protein